MTPLYFDHAASTPLHPQVLEAMLPYFSHHYGNASSIHRFGQEARLALQRSRDQIASIIHCQPGELLFTSGGTESDNLALMGVAFSPYVVNSSKRHLITTKIEHPAVLQTCRRLEQLGYSISYITPNEKGYIEPESILSAIQDDTFLISVMYGNNEIGTIQPIIQIGQIAREHQIFFHTDAVQALGYVDFDLSILPVDLASFSSHKINGPKGIGALYVSASTQIEPVIFGGKQERNRRGGTENIPAIVGFAKALQLKDQSRNEQVNHISQLRREMIAGLNEGLLPHQFKVHGGLDMNNMLPHILNVSFPQVESEVMLMNLDLEGICAASGSACSSGAIEPSHVLRAMDLRDEWLQTAIRFSFGMENKVEDITYLVKTIQKIIQRLS